MKVYAKTRRLLPLTLITVVVPVMPSLGAATIAFPDVIGSGGGSIIALSALAPFVLALCLIWSLAARRTHLTENQVRNTAIADAGLLIAINLVVAGGTVLVPAGDLVVARNALFLTGMGAALSVVASTAAAGAITTFLVLFVMTYGSSAPGARFVRILQAPMEVPWASGFALLVMLSASLALAFVGPDWHERALGASQRLRDHTIGRGAGDIPRG